MSYPPPQTQQPGYGPPMGQPQYGQPQYGQPQYGQPQYGQQPVAMAAPVQYGQQPGAPPPGGEWMAMPMMQVPNCPPALAYLSTLDQLIVKQQMEMLEMFIDFETSNKYKIKNIHGQTIFLAAEDTDCCSRNCFGSLRPFDMKIMDNAKNEMIHLYRPLACDGCCFPCSRQSMEVSCPPGTVIGSLEKEWSILTPKFLVKDASGQTVLKIEGPLCTMAMCGTVEFEVLSADGSTQVGKISKNWSGIGREMFTDADTFGISFPMDLDVKIKAVLLGAVFLIDYLYFERSK